MGLALTRRYVYAALLLAAAGLLFIAVKPLAVYLGYEGVKTFFEGVGFQNSYGVPSLPGYVWARIGSSPPFQLWDFHEDHFTVDPYDEYDHWQDLGGEITTNAIPERGVFGNIITDKTSWNVTVGEMSGGTIYKRIDAEVYYFISKATFSTDADEKSGVFPWDFHTERDDPYQALNIIIRIAAHDWRFDGNLRNESFAAILGVEILSAEIVSGKSIVFQPLFSVGTMLAMYPDWDSATGGVGGYTGRDVSYVRSLVGSDLLPSPDLRNEVYVTLGFREFGVEARDPSWSDLKASITLRIHTLKVDKWILLQTRGGEVKPLVDVAEDPLKSFWEGLAALLTSPWTLFGAGIIGTVALLLFILVLILVFAPWIIPVILGRGGRGER